MRFCYKTARFIIEPLEAGESWCMEIHLVPIPLRQCSTQANRFVSLNLIRTNDSGFMPYALTLLLNCELYTSGSTFPLEYQSLRCCVFVLLVDALF
jgi:hypothetical protein